MRHRAVFFFPLLLIAPSAAMAAGLEFPWQSTSAMGSANANAAEAADASTIYFNPAGMARLKGTQVSQGVQILSVRGRFEDQGSAQVDGRSTAGNDEGTYHPQLIGGGEFYAVTPYDDQITLGLGVFVPYGANVNYKSDWAGRFSVDRAAIESVNINPSFSLRFDDKHAIGFGVSTQIMHLRLRSGADVQNAVAGVAQNAAFEFAGGVPNAICTGLNIGLVNGLCNLTASAIGTLLTSDNPLLGTQAVQGEGVLNVEGYGYGFGWNAGYLFSFNDDNSRFSVSYRSKIKQTIKGEFDWDFSRVTGRIPNPNDPLSVLTTGALDAKTYIEQYVRPDTDSTIKLTTPEVAIAGLFHQITPKLALMTTVNWTRASRLNELRIQAEDRTDPDGNTIRQGDVVVKTKFRDVFKLGLGANYRLNERWMARAGLGYEQTPVPNAQARHASLPDANRRLYSLGLNYMKDKKTSIDLAYSFISLEDVSADYEDGCHPTGYNMPGQPTGVQATDECTGNADKFKGRFKDTYVNSLGVQLNQRF